MTQIIMVFNSGSSSFKFSLFSVDETLLLHGIADKLGHDDAYIELRRGKDRQHVAITGATHRQAISKLIDILPTFDIQFRDIAIVGHRVVHGGEKFSRSVLIDDQVREQIATCNSLAPLHNPKNLLGIEIMQDLSPELPQVAVFDTAFHQTLPQNAFLYAIPWNLYQQLGVRRYGFHGTSHRYVAQSAMDQLALDRDDSQLLTAHLGNGCSACAIVNGRSVDTTMGLTPLEGLMMGTRSGDVDPSLHEFLQERLDWSTARTTEMLNHESGLLGLSQKSNDMRTVYAAALAGDQQCKLAFDVFCFRVARQLSALAVSLQRIDALVFTGGIGENHAPTRAAVIQQMSLFGFKLDSAGNAEHGRNRRGLITTPDSTRACVVKTDEELMIARDCIQLLAQAH